MTHERWTYNFAVTVEDGQGKELKSRGYTWQTTFGKSQPNGSLRPYAKNHALNLATQDGFRSPKVTRISIADAADTVLR
jgi:hypothetical protein